VGRTGALALIVLSARGERDVDIDPTAARFLDSVAVELDRYRGVVLRDDCHEPPAPSAGERASRSPRSS
jgi:hypothetical protein